jgi:hypothetical protein
MRETAPTTEYFPTAAEPASLQEHWDALHAGERARRQLCPDARDTVCELVPRAPEPDDAEHWREARAEWAQRDNTKTQAATPRALQETL